MFLTICLLCILKAIYLTSSHFLCYTLHYKTSYGKEKKTKSMTRVSLHILIDSPWKMHFIRQAVVKIRKCNPVLCPHRLSNNDLVDVVKLIPILIMDIHISH